MPPDNFLPRRLALCTALATLAGCASAPRVPGERGVVAPIPAPELPTAPEPASPAKPVPPPSPLAYEQRFLEGWFRGTPVVISALNASQLNVAVPLANSFDAGKLEIKPALGAVLERVSESLRRQPGARIVVAAAGDSDNAALAQARAQRVREHLQARAIAAPRIDVGPAVRPGGSVQLRLTIPAAAFPSAARAL